MSKTALSWKVTGGKFEKPDIVELSVGEHRLIVHRHIHYDPKDWFLTYGPFLYRYELKSRDLEEAKKEALKVVLKKVQEFYKMVRHDLGVGP